MQQSTIDRQRLIHNLSAVRLLASTFQAALCCTHKQVVKSSFYDRQDKLSP